MEGKVDPDELVTGFVRGGCFRDFTVLLIYFAFGHLERFGDVG